jgi:23S rRNA (adenine2503-C2)-methyltransferase
LLPAPGISPEPCVLAEATIETLAARVRAWGCKPSHAAPLLRSFYARDGEASLPTGLWPEELRRRWPVECVAETSLPGLRQASADGTVKLLRRLHDGRSVECVLMPDHRADRAAGCVSSQVGCAMGCDFCATTKTGFERNLTSGEIVEQFLALRREARAAGRRRQMSAAELTDREMTRILNDRSLEAAQAGRNMYKKGGKVAAKGRKK